MSTLVTNFKKEQQQNNNMANDQKHKQACLCLKRNTQCSGAVLLSSVDDTIFLIMFLLMTAGIWNMVCIKGDKISEGVLIFIRTQRNDLGYVQFGALFYFRTKNQRAFHSIFELICQNLVKTFISGPYSFKSFESLTYSLKVVKEIFFPIC